MVAAFGGRGVAGTVFAIFIVVVIASWALMFIVLIGVLAVAYLMRGRHARARRAAPSAGADPHLPSRLAEVRRADPHFDPQLLLEAAQMVCLVMFAAMSTGDEQAIRWLAAPSFWPTFFGKYLQMSARDARRERALPKDPDRPSSRYLRLPVDYQASAPELISLDLGPRQRARVRVAFNQLRAIISYGARGEAGAADIKSAGSVAAAIGTVVAASMSERGPRTPGPGWLLWAGRYDLDFARPAGARTDPAAAVASRTCAHCGATYRSEFSTACEHCGADRPLAWGLWRLTGITPVE